MTLILSLKKMKVGELKKEISKQNIKKYSKLKKGELIALMSSDEHKDKFDYLIKSKEELKQMKKPRSEKQKANDKKLGEMAKKKSAEKKKPVTKKTDEPKPVEKPVEKPVDNADEYYKEFVKYNDKFNRINTIKRIPNSKDFDKEKKRLNKEETRLLEIKIKLFDLIKDEKRKQNKPV